jgi:hypothetical protein
MGKVSETKVDELMSIDPTAPRVNQCIADVMARFPDTTPRGLARYFEAVHQELAPLARELEREVAKLKADMEAMWSQRAAERAQAKKGEGHADQT